MSCEVRRRAFLGGAVGTTLSLRAAKAGRRLVRIGQGGTAATPAGIACRAFADAVAGEPLLSGILHVEVYDEGELGDDLPALRSCVRGTVEMVICGTVVLGSFHPVAGVLDTPFLFRNAATARAVLDGPIGTEIAQMLHSKGINLLAWAENGMRQMTANKPIRSPADLVGLRLRVPQSDVELNAFRALGAQARAIPYLAIHEALRTGDFEAQENPIANIESARFYEVQKVLSLTGHIYSAGAIVASADLLDDLDPAQRAALAACARRGGAAMRQAAETADRDGVARLRNNGMQVISDVDTAAFIAKSKEYLQSLGKVYGEDFMTRLIRAAS